MSTQKSTNLHLVYKPSDAKRHIILTIKSTYLPFNKYKKQILSSILI